MATPVLQLSDFDKFTWHGKVAINTDGIAAICLRDVCSSNKLIG
jgi:hypothetical protein